MPTLTVDTEKYPSFKDAKPGDVLTATIKSINDNEFELDYSTVKIKTPPAKGKGGFFDGKSEDEMKHMPKEMLKSKIRAEQMAQG